MELTEAIAKCVGIKPEKHAEPELLQNLELNPVDLMETGLEVEGLGEAGE